MKYSLLERLGLKGSRTVEVKRSERELEIRDWKVKEFQTKIKTWALFSMVECKEMERSLRETPERKKKAEH